MNEIAPPNFRGIEVELAGDAVHDFFHHVNRLGPARAAHHHRRHLVGVKRFELQLQVGNLVRPRDRRQRDPRHHQACAVGAGVVEKEVFQAGNFAVVVERRFDPMSLIAFLAAGDEMFAPVFDPFDRRAETHGQPRNQKILWIKTTLRPEATAHPWRDHAHFMLGHVHELQQSPANPVRPLTGCPDG